MVRQKNLNAFELSENQYKIVNYLSNVEDKVRHIQTRRIIHENTGIPMTTLENNLKKMMDFGFITRKDVESTELTKKGRPSMYFEMDQHAHIEKNETIWIVTYE